MQPNNFLNFGWPVYNLVWIFPLIAILVIADLILRGYSLWLSAKKDQKVWFVFLLFVNSLGILPLIYLLVNRADLKKKRK